jgi:lambda repressor-like predicted transcriptional regulator
MKALISLLVKSPPPQPRRQRVADPRPDQPRYPLDALVEASGMTEAALARHVGLSGSTLRVARLKGLTMDAADRYAIRAGLHPLEVWPQLVEDLEAARLERRREIARESARRRYHEDPDVRARRIASSAAWRATAGRSLRFMPSRQPEARRSASKAYYQRNREAILARRRERYATQREERAA